MGKVGPKLEKLLFFQRNQGQLFKFCSGRLEALILHILDPNYSFFYLNVPENIKKPIILTFFDTFPHLHLSLPSKF